MCGIIGYNGFRDANKVLIDGLKRLEYRGYDSAGIGIIGKKLQIFKEVGEISKLETEIPVFDGDIGIGHTRWATHGAVTKENAHPQLSTNKKIAVIHNGIIENFKSLREQLEKKGVKFNSQTDSEVIAQLINENYKGNLRDAVITTIKKLRGSYAIAVVCQEEPEILVGARNESPLVIGVGDNENFLASDISALLKYTNRVKYLDDGEICVLSKTSSKVFNQNKKEISKKEDIIDWEIKDAEKSGFPHFMLKEIFEQPEAINRALLGRVSEIDRTIRLHEKVEDLLNFDVQSIHIIACGTSFYSGLVGKYLIEQLTDIPVFVELASEYRYFGTKNKKSLIIGITQSGETADTLAALREAKNAGCRTMIITNVMGSTATRIANAYILTQSGPEIGVAATKTFTSQILILLLIAFKLATLNNKLGADELSKYIFHLKKLPRKVREVLDHNDRILDVAVQLKNVNSVFFIGRGINYPLSLEGALKLKEISYVHAEGFAAGELKHGPFALLTQITPVIAIVTKDNTYDKMIANIGEVKARGPEVIAIADENDTEIEKHADYVIRFPGNSSPLSS
ncbi:MAG: glutamine--fructose-6-phosphate transaminase (isomerizing), partial [Thermoplasmatales archaeon]